MEPNAPSVIPARTASGLDLRSSTTAAARTVDTLIPVVQRCAGRAALPRTPHLHLHVGSAGEVALRFVVLSSR